MNDTNFTIIPMMDNSTSGSKPDCLVLQYQDSFLPWDDPANLISARTEEVVRRWKNTVFLPILFLIGGPANVINMAVFYKQGLKERINVCLFALSMADFLYLIYSIIFHGENMHLNSKERYGPITRYMTNHNLVGFSGFTWVSEILSAIIASERCFCILQPFRSQTVLRTSTTTAIVIAVNVVVVGVYFFVAYRYRIACVYDSVNHDVFTTLLAGEFYLNHQKLIDYLDTFVYGVGIPGVVMVVVTVTTVATTVKLRQSAAWRSATSTGGSVTSREVAVTKMLLANSLFFIVCIFPIALFRFTWLFVPDLKIGGRQHNLFLAGIWILDICSYVNSAFNIFVYYVMGSRYRAILWQLLRKKGKATP